MRTVALGSVLLLLVLIGVFWWGLRDFPAPRVVDVDPTLPIEEEPIDAPTLRGSTPRLKDALPESAPPPPPPIAQADRYVVHGRIVDTKGYGVRGGTLALNRGDVLSVARGPRPGDFVVGMPVSEGVLLYWEGPGGLVSQPLWLKSTPGAVYGPVELVARKRSRLTVRVQYPDGAPASGGSLWAQGAPHGRVEHRLDAAGEATFDAAPRHLWLDGVSKDEHYRVRGSVTPPEGEAHAATLTLIGPWVQHDVALTSKDGALRGERASLSIDAGDGTYSHTSLVVDEGPTSVWLPPASEGPGNIRLTGKRIMPYYVTERWDRVMTRRILAKHPWTIPVHPIARVRLRVVHPDGRVIPYFPFRAENRWLVTDGEGFATLDLPFGRHRITLESGQSVGAITVASRDETQDLVLAGLQPIGGPYEGPEPHNPFLDWVLVKTKEGAKYQGSVIEQEARWEAWLPVARGTPVEVSVEAMLRNFADPCSGTVGQADLPLRVRAGTLRAQPIVGTNRRPVGLLRVRGVDVAYGNNVTVTVSHNVAHLTPIPLGTYRFDWSWDNGKTWIESKQQVTVGDTPMHVDVLFPER